MSESERLKQIEAANRRIGVSDQSAGQAMTTTDRLKTLLDARHAFGLAKYGTTVDRTDLTPDQWAQHAIEELLDGAAYLMRLREEIAKRQERIAALDAHVKRLEKALGCVVPSCNSLHHAKKHQHKSCEPCPVELIIRQAKEAKP